MTTPITDQRLSQITTQWTKIFSAHRERSMVNQDENSIASAQKLVLERYAHCIYRYLLGATKDANIAEELSQEFAFRFVRGDLKNVSPDRGRFRDYLKTVLRNIVNDYFRSQQKERALHVQPAWTEHKSMPLAETEKAFKESWRQEILAATWSQLEGYQTRKANRYYTVLRFRAEHPSSDSSSIARDLTVQLGTPVNSDWVRQNLKRAREKFRTLLIAEVAKTLPLNAAQDEIEAELADLRLLKYL